MTDVRAGAGRTPSRAVEQALVDAAERVLVRDGLGAVTVRAVATEAGVAPMGVYNRFGSKDGLIAAVLVRGFDGLRAAVTADPDPDPIARLLASGRNYRRFALAQPQHYGAMFGGRPLLTEGADELVAHAAAAFEALVDHVRYAMARGALREEDPTETAQLIWSSVHGAVSLELGGAVLTPDPAVTYESLLQLIVDGLRRPHP
ncbi:TetR/AcrR family transcriptional regulator [Modestobacter sp. VKM Ac-2985]|uniref:TetR/AcrR family transcriptional regulator n=1 Tax=Modestobacter sp. VKM Ac-2985 TaxID=3004139 RepID=UPI0022ABC3E5|nr:TetR/AcrR family transcriptional regulator [Modestobacter sp. VKM Ac-2985]MCZ2836812.1 TetR/AcrR family transcriptional regulator [Modestobacter sp. VKM Ac-2985]